jgi:hypothetical protein
VTFGKKLQLFWTTMTLLQWWIFVSDVSAKFISCVTRKSYLTGSVEQDHFAVQPPGSLRGIIIHSNHVTSGASRDCWKQWRQNRLSCHSMTEPWERNAV